MSQLERFQSETKISANREWVSYYIENGSNYPITLEIDPTNTCPLGCEKCIWHEFREGVKDSLSAEVMMRVVEEAALLGVKSIIWTGGGEPLANSGTISAILRYNELGMKNGMFTTGVSLTPRRTEELLDVLSWVRFHLDGSSANTYSRIHQVPKSVYYKVIENIGNFTKRKKEKGSKISIGIGSVALYENFSEVSELARLTKRLGLDYFQYKHDLTQMTNSEYMTWWNSDVTTMLQELSCELESSTFKLQFSNNINYEVPDLSPFCHIHHMNTAITADGRVGYC